MIEMDTGLTLEIGKECELSLAINRGIRPQTCFVEAQLEKAHEWVACENNTFAN